MVRDDLDKKFGDGSGSKPMKSAQFSIALLMEEFETLLLADFFFAFFSIMFVWIFLSVHLRSFFLSSIGTILIIFSFPFTMIIVAGIFQVSYFGSLQVISIYIVLGIAADDIFVFVDAWRQSANVSPEIFQNDKKKRMAYAFRRGVRAMAVTSSTTSVAFFSNIFSPLMEIQAFGIFSGVIIPVNYFLVVMLIPPAVIIYEANKCCCCCKREKDLAITEQEDR